MGAHDVDHEVGAEDGEVVDTDDLGRLPPLARLVGLCFVFQQAV